MTERQKKMNHVQMHDFARLESILYLDGHPDDEKALQYFHQQTGKLNEASKAYEEAYGPISSCSMHHKKDGKGFLWMQDPWPWEKEAN